MITTLILLCLSLLDIQHPRITDEFGKQFVVTELVEQSTTGCASNPQSGGVVNHQIFVDFVNNNDPHEGATPVSAMSVSNYNAVTESPTVPAMMPHDPSGLPNPNPDPSPMATTPEPPTVAILGISLASLMYLIFGRRKKERLYRRT